MREPLAAGRTLEADSLEPVKGSRPSKEPATRARRRLGPLRGTVAGIVAIGAKDLRGRMRGRRAFLILTGYLVLLAAFALSTQAAIADTYQTGFGGSAAFAGAAIGQGVFGAMLMLMTFLVVVLAPLATASSISLEREKQTLDLLMATPIPSLAIVVGKLLSALAWVFLLIAASVPLMAIVFVYGGVGPDALISGYLVLIAIALGLGALGLFCSSVVKRTTVATALTIVGVLLVTFPTVTQLLAGPGVAVGGVGDGSGRSAGLIGLPVPEAIVRLDPFVAQTDVMCGTESTFGGRWCSAVQALVPTGDGNLFGGSPVPVERAPVGPGGFVNEKGVAVAVGDDVIGRVGLGGADVAPGPAQAFGMQRDALWPKSVATWLILSVVFLGLSVQFVSPTRRWRLRRGPRASARTAP
jgi:ABC-type transport system involved in multi-copper enzyme maturation permease subunit